MPLNSAEHTALTLEELKHGEGNQVLLQSVFDTNLIGIAVLKAVRDKKGTIRDFEIRAINKVLEIETGRTDLVGKRYAKIFPGVRKMGLFQLMLKVVETGNSEQIEYAYQYDGFDKWFNSMFVKMDDGLVSSNQDITGRKRVELERQKNLVLLQQAEEITRMGSWEYNLRTGEFLWSAGMYRLFGLAGTKKVRPEIYLEYATKKCLPVAGRIVDNIKAGKPDFEETLEILVAKKVKIVKIKAALLTFAVDASERVIGVDLDVTVQEEKSQLESKYKAMEAEQNRKIFQATLNSQEEERKRIAESLHNSLGQLLYGVKLSLEQINLDKAELDVEWLRQAKKRTSDLLTESIKESRRISHEMTPTILEDFGLKYAINDICNQFKQDIKISCHFTGNRKLNKYLEIAIYRIVQELIINIFKHAQATDAMVSIVIHKKTVSLIVQDNGIGINDLGTGIGLKTIQNRVRLLNGKFNLSWGKGENTIISISFPYEPD